MRIKEDFRIKKTDAYKNIHFLITGKEYNYKKDRLKKALKRIEKKLEIFLKNKVLKMLLKAILYLLNFI